MSGKNQGKDFKFYNPRDTNDILYSLIEDKGVKYEFKKKYPKNINLLFSKLVPQIGNIGNKREQDRKRGRIKEKHLNLIIDEFKELKNNLNIFKLLEKRIEKLTENLKNSGFYFEKIDAKCNWRLVIGLGGMHPHETSMTLHHIYGIPYIPASAIKGITRHWAIIKFATKYHENSGKNIEDCIKEISNLIEKKQNISNLNINGTTIEELTEIFGNQKQVGKVIFLDAYPIENVDLKIDIMNVHYPEYYSGNKPPADWQNPNPIKFLTLENAKFRFIVLSREKGLLEKAKELLKEALQNHGIGAKTSLGYGIFSI